MLFVGLFGLGLIRVVGAVVLQKPLLASPSHYLDPDNQPESRKLHGRFLHITDIHPDPFYSIYSSTSDGIACHRGSGPAGYYGAETSDCDSSFELINATFRWIEDNLANKIDFVIWTGDSARHDNDEHHPRTTAQVLEQNRLLVTKFGEIFGSGNGNAGTMSIPIVPSFGNNDVLPHNLFFKGPNTWTRAYSDVWRPFIPEAQRHGFDRGGWFYREVIPGKLAVFSLNTMYFFDSNTAVDGCARPSEPGHEHFEWLRTQLQFLRERGVKAIMTGHVPPSRNDEKVGWDETCWQKYALWMQQYRDVVVGSIYGHMNVEHFVLQDFKDIDLAFLTGETSAKSQDWAMGGDEISIELNTPDYLNALRALWSNLPSVPDDLFFPESASTPGPGSAYIEKKKKKKNHKKKTEQQKFYEKIGGPFAERFAVSHISASVVPNFFSSLRVYEYNITGLEDETVDASLGTIVPDPPRWQERIDEGQESIWDFHWTYPTARRRRFLVSDLTDYFGPLNPFKKKKHKKHKHKKPNFTVPDPPSKQSPPGPAYSPQTLSWTGYTQYLANITHLNNDSISTSSARRFGDDVNVQGWNPGKYEDVRPGEGRKKPQPRSFVYEVEYDTRDRGDAYGMSDGVMSVRRWVELAARIGEFKEKKGKYLVDGTFADDEDEEREDQDEDGGKEEKELGNTLEDEIDGSDHSHEGGAEEGGLQNITRALKRKKGKHHKERKKRRKIVNESWYAFVSRAVVSTMEADELHETFGED